VESPYHDPKSSAEKPKWFHSHVAFREKFEHPERVTLSVLREYAGPGGVLESMQLFKQSRLSVTRVAKTEWETILKLAAGEPVEDAAAGAGASEEPDELEDQVGDERTEAMEPVVTNGAFQTDLTEVVMQQAIGLLQEAAQEVAARETGKHHRIHLLSAR
jgi:EVE domain